MNEEKLILGHPALEDLNTVLTELDDAETRVKALKQKLAETVLNLPSRLGENEDLRDEAVHYLYWFEERVNATTLKQAFDVISPSHASKKSTNVLRQPTIEEVCKTCNQTFLAKITSRSAFKERRWSKECEECEEKRHLTNRQYFERQRQREAALQQRQYELRTMPYYKYLQTPEWQERRKRAMKKAGFRCQVCNAYGVRLNTHHRTYERRGNERDTDLITLCEACHQIFHDNGKLAQ